MTIEQADFRRSARRLRQVLTFASWFIAAVIVAERAGYAGAYRAQFDARSLLVQLALSVPAILYLGSLVSLRSAVAAAVDGEAFGAVVVKAFRRVGALLAAGSIGALLVPLIGRLIGERLPRLIDADVATLILGFLGLGLFFVGTLIDRAGAAQRELEEFF